MTQHTVVAVYETAAQAAAAVRDLQAANILPDAISQHTKTFSASDTGLLSAAARAGVLGRSVR